jgi:hypothetical protein
MTQTHVVLTDPSGEFWEGALVSAETAHMLRRRRAVTLPIEPTLLQRSALAGYYRRAWGSGWPLSETIPRMHCPMILYAVPPNVVQAGRLNFAVRLVPDTNAMEAARERGGAAFIGSIRLAPETGQPGTHAGGFSPSTQEDIVTAFDLSKLGPLDADGGWTVVGCAQLNVPSEGFFACALYGAAAGLRVAWAAVSQSG